jgi:hypothetical protein
MRPVSLVIKMDVNSDLYFKLFLLKLRMFGFMWGPRVKSKKRMVVAEWRKQYKLFFCLPSSTSNVLIDHAVGSINDFLE